MYDADDLLHGLSATCKGLVSRLLYVAPLWQNHRRLDPILGAVKIFLLSCRFAIEVNGWDLNSQQNFSSDKILPTQTQNSTLEHSKCLGSILRKRCIHVWNRKKTSMKWESKLILRSLSCWAIDQRLTWRTYLVSMVQANLKGQGLKEEWLALGYLKIIYSQQ